MRNDTPYELIKQLKPNILIKGGDYNLDEIIGKDIVEENQGYVTTIPEIEGAEHLTNYKKNIATLSKWNPRKLIATSAVFFKSLGSHNTRMLV